MQIVKGVRVHQQSNATQQEDIDRENLLKPRIAWLDSVRSPQVWIAIVASILWALSPLRGVHSPGGLFLLFMAFVIAGLILPWRLHRILGSAFSRIREFSLLISAVVFAVFVTTGLVFLLFTPIYLLRLFDVPFSTPGLFVANLVIALATISLSKFVVNAIWTVAHTIQRIRQLKRVLSQADPSAIQGELFLKINHLFLVSADDTQNASSAHEISDGQGAH